MTRALLPWLLIALICAHPDQRGQELLERWTTAVVGHKPGAADDWMVAIGDWPKDQLISTLNEVRPGRPPDSVLRLGAVLHFDISLGGSPRARGPLFRTYPSNGPRAPSPVTLLALDGRDEGRGSTDTHLEFARALLKELPPGAVTDDFVRLWYEAVAARLAGLRNFAELVLHLDHARRILPTDPEILFASGCLHEALAAPRTQALIRAASGYAVAPAVGSAATNLAEAERYYRRVLSALPGFGEARLRLGRVLGLRGRHKDAVLELERAIDDAEDSTESYYALLFLGREEEVLGRLDSARRRFERAATLFPSAQAPQISLSRLAREPGDDRAAQVILSRILTRTAADDPLDPWWAYEEGPGRHAERLIARLYTAAAQDVR